MNIYFKKYLLKEKRETATQSKPLHRLRDAAEVHASCSTQSPVIITELRDKRPFPLTSTPPSHPPPRPHPRTVRGRRRETHADTGPACRHHTESPGGIEPATLLAPSEVARAEMLPCALSFRLTHQKRQRTCQRLPRPNEAIITEEKQTGIILGSREKTCHFISDMTHA